MSRLATPLMVARDPGTVRDQCAATQPQYIPALDGVRGIAILLVIAFHARVAFSSTAEIPYVAFRFLGLGWSGVDLFFVLSGFLITGILLDSRDGPRYFRRFYWRRVLRIFPLYFAYLFLILVVCRYAWLAWSGVDLWKGTNPWWYFSYLLNWKSDHGFNDLYLGHLWSLAIEEQFYLVWPATVWLVPRRKLKWLCLAVAGGALAARCYLGTHGYDAEAVYRMTPCRMDGLALGAFVAIGLRDFRESLNRYAPAVLLTSGWGTLCVVAVAPGPVWSDALMRTLGASLIVITYACVVFYSAALRDGRVQRLLASPWLRKVGKYSYAMYVLHSMPFHLTGPALHQLSNSALPAPLMLVARYLYFPALAGFAFGMAWISWHALEKRFILLKGALSDPPPANGARPAAPPQCLPGAPLKLRPADQPASTSALTSSYQLADFVSPGPIPGTNVAPDKLR